MSRLFPPRAAIAWIVAAVVLFSMPTLQGLFGFPIYNLIFLYLVFFWITQATSWNIFSGYSGYFSFGQAAFYGAGMYTTAILGSRHGWGLLPTLPVAAAVGASIALVVGLLVFRLRKIAGEIFALFTLVVALGLSALSNNWTAIDGGRGILLGQLSYPSWLGTTTEMLYYLGLVIAFGAVFSAYAIQHSRFGAGLFAIRDDEKVAEAIGVPTFRSKLVIFTLNGLIAGLSGGLHAVQVNFISPASAYPLRIPVFVILMSVVGGRRRWFGPVLGAVVIHTIVDRMAGAGYAEASQIVLATVLILATLFLRGGMAERLVERPRVALVTFVATCIVAAVVLSIPAITVFAYGLAALLVVLFIPDGIYARLARRRPGGGRAGDDAPDAPEPLAQEARR